MIAANELRIGNWVAEGGLPVQIESINVGNVACQPIPLTPEILEKCGFVYVENIAHWANTDDDLSYYKIEMPNTGNSMEIFLDYSCSYFQGNAITSLHQLQNLYFALTGEELKVQL